MTHNFWTSWPLETRSDARSMTERPSSTESLRISSGDYKQIYSNIINSKYVSSIHPSTISRVNYCAVFVSPCHFGESFQSEAVQIHRQELFAETLVSCLWNHNPIPPFLSCKTTSKSCWCCLAPELNAFRITLFNAHMYPWQQKLEVWCHAPSLLDVWICLVSNAAQ